MTDLYAAVNVPLLAAAPHAAARTLAPASSESSQSSSPESRRSESCRVAGLVAVADADVRKKPLSLTHAVSRFGSYKETGAL